MNDVQFNTLEEWNRRASRATWAYSEAAGLCGIWHVVLGIPLVVCTVIVGSLSKGNNASAAIAPMSIVAAVLAGLQTFLNLSSKAQLYKKAASAYSNVRRSIEDLVAIPPPSPHDLVAAIKKLRDTIDTLSETTPSVPTYVWRRACKKYDKNTFKSSLIRIQTTSEVT